jgi:phage terminase small subunit
MDSSDLDTFDHLNTNQQEAFVSAVVEGANYREAAEQAGYSPGYGRRLAQKDHIQQAIQELREEAREESIVTASQVANGLLEEAQRTGEDASHAARVRAWELLGEHIGMFDETRGEPDQQVNIYQEINRRIEDTDETVDTDE